MLNLTSAALKNFLALDPCDMRKSFNGLHTLASDQLQAATARDALFVFTNKRRNRIVSGLFSASSRPFAYQAYISVYAIYIIPSPDRRFHDHPHRQ